MLRRSCSTGLEWHFQQQWSNWAPSSPHSPPPVFSSLSSPTRADPLLDLWQDGLLDPNLQVEEMVGEGRWREERTGRVWANASPHPKLPPGSASAGLTGRGSGVAGVWGPPFRLR